MNWLSVRQIPNLITVMRIFLVGPTVWLILERRFDWALGLFFVAGVSDALDGYLAKHFGWFSRLGSLLDPIADKLLIVACYVAGAWIGLLPGWLAELVVARDLVILLGGVVYYLFLHPFEGQPSWISKFNTLCQIVLLLVLFWQHGFRPLPTGWSTGLIYLVSVTTVVSGIQYVHLWGSYFSSEVGKRRHS
ncbi:CDP-alcohol phosphatidyltransferase family protein [Methylohalobius crimeensis]|uniref:CDP-alcohol phosphatidyltransferase family protein n=1 Tax=Methylohalobius crimeensis TaxID=244365 RepID=UPI0003B68CA1|nr:CDP-alcohol phosphatidyltransferase family protein [Methylohalobius crimeensis]